MACSTVRTLLLVPDCEVRDFAIYGGLRMHVMMADMALDDMALDRLAALRLGALYLRARWGCWATMSAKIGQRRRVYTQHWAFGDAALAGDLAAGRWWAGSACASPPKQCLATAVSRFFLLLLCCLGLP